MPRNGPDDRPDADPIVDLGALGELLGYRLRRAQVAVFADFVRALAGLELRPTTFGVLVVIDGNPGISQAAVCDTLGIQRANFVAIAGELERRGLVARTTSKVDRRQNALNLTTEGRRLLRRAWVAVRGHEERIASKLRTAERLRLRDLLVEVEDFHRVPVRDRPKGLRARRPVRTGD